jgi:hypothetical protein
MADTQSRKWQFTINNPLDHGFSHGHIRRLVEEMKYQYWCMADEVGENGTYHTHVYICFSTPRKFSALKSRFPSAHFEDVRGTSQQNRDYVSKTGKWLKDRKGGTSVAGTFEEYGEIPVERQGQRNDLHDVYGMVKGGLTDYEILEQHPDCLLYLDKIERTRQAIKYDSFRSLWRDLTVSYVWGDTGLGKTRAIMERHGYGNVYRVTDYLHPFDGYSSQDAVVFEEFRSSLRVGDMLNYLDGYPLELPCRYFNRQACFTKVYIVSNIPLGQQYMHLQLESIGSYLAFLRRIGRVFHYVPGRVEVSYIELTGDGFRPVFDEELPSIPF